MRNALTLASTVVFILLSLLSQPARGETKPGGQPSSASSNHAVSLNGTGTYINVPGSESLNITGAFTVEAWIKTNSNTVQQGIIERYNWLGTADDGGYGIRLTSDGRLQLFTVRIAGVADGLNGNTVVQPGVWHHVAGVFDGSQMRIYLDGALDGSKASTLAPGTGTNNLKIGARGDVENFPVANALTFDGLIDDVRVTGGTVYRANFSPQFPLTTGVLVEAIDGSGVRGYWDFNEQTVNDSSDNNNHGSLLNGAYYSLADVSNNLETIWVEDAIPTGGIAGGDSEGWNWISSNPQASSGAVSHQSSLFAGIHQHYFYGATSGLTINSGDRVGTYVYLDPNNLPQEIMLQWNDGNWDHRAYWGANIIPWGTDSTETRRYMGELPAAGQWVKLEVPASLLGLEGKTLNGMAFTMYGGRATWDRAGKFSATPVPTGDTVWIEDAVPAGGATAGEYEGWNWVGSNPTPYSGTTAHQSNLFAGIHQHYFHNATNNLIINAGDTLFTYIYLDPAAMPSELMLQWNDGNWDHRAYWGANIIPWGTDGTYTRRYMGALPPAGQWVRLEVPANLVGLEGRTLNGMAFTMYGGRATWDRAGKSTVFNNQPATTTIQQPHAVDFERFSLGAYITNQHAPYATFAAIKSPYSADAANVVVGDASGNYASGWKAVWTQQGVYDKNLPLNVSFPQTANNLTFYVLNALNYYGRPFIVCKIEVHRNGSYYDTFDLWSPGNTRARLVDLRGITNITSLFIYNIRAPAGPLGSYQEHTIFFDDFEFTSPEECPAAGAGMSATAASTCPTPTPTPTPTPQVTSVNFEETYTGQLTLNPNITLSGSTKGGCTGKCGLRIFPDKQFVNDSVNRALIKVRANTTYPANTLIYFRSFDIDDPSTDVSPLDPNGSSGSDNRGGGTGIFPARTDSSGVARIDFTTSKYAGDNYVIAASADQAYLNSLTVDGVILRDPSTGESLPTAKAKGSLQLTVWRNLHIEVDSMGAVTGNNVGGTINDVIVPTNCPKGSTNTICRDTTHRRVFVDQVLEVNRFEGGRLIVDGQTYKVVSNTDSSLYISTPDWTPGIGRPFTVYDDDDFNLNDGIAKRGDMGEDVNPTPETFSLMRNSDNPSENVFALAYIRPVYDGGGNPTNDSSNVPFALNIMFGGFWPQINLGMNSEANESDDFWVVYLQLAYQPDSSFDYDPNDVGGDLGATRFDRNVSQDSTNNVADSSQVPKGARASFLYLEMIQEASSRNILYGMDNYRLVAPHEVGHQFGLAGDTSPHTGGVDYGLMSYGNGMIAPNPPYLKFVPAHLNILRWRVKSPGQL